MESPKTSSNDPRRVEEPPPAHDQRGTSRKESRATHFVDPYDMRAEPPQEEPGYGHGV